MMKKLSSPSEKLILKSAMSLAEILSLDLEAIDTETIEIGRSIIVIDEDRTLDRRFPNYKELKIELIRDVIIDLSSGAQWLQKGSFGLAVKGTKLQKLYILSEQNFKGTFVYEFVLEERYKTKKLFNQNELNCAVYYVILHWSEYLRILSRKSA